jgi:hypothetical protein
VGGSVKGCSDVGEGGKTGGGLEFKKTAGVERGGKSDQGGGAWRCEAEEVGRVCVEESVGRETVESKAAMEELRGKQVVRGAGYVVGGCGKREGVR